MGLDLSKYQNRFSLRHKIQRALWGVVWTLLFRPSPRVCFAWRHFLLRSFGAKIGKGSLVYPTCRIWAPWNLEIGEFVCLSFDVDCYCVDKVTIADQTTISQYAYLCTASHDITDPHMRLITAPITIGPNAWICAGAFVSPGVTIGEGAVAAARAVVVKDVPPWTVVGGNPAKFIKTRTLREEV